MLPNIQVLRWIAASLVVLFHAAATMRGEGHAPALTGQFADWAESGVDIFFVISGFVMVLSQSRKRRGFADFLGERALRILPLYWSLTLAMGAALFFAPQLFHSDRFSALRLMASLGMVANPVFDQFPVIYVGWTLEWEAIFYIVFALSCAVLPLRWAWVGVGAVFVLGGTLGISPLFLVEFAFGMALCSLWLALGMPRHGGLGVALLALGAPLMPLAMAGIEGRFLLWGPGAVAIVAGLVLMPQLRGAWALRLGAASYAVYLVQVPVLPLAFRLVAKLAPGMGGDLRVIVASAIALAAGLACHLWFEAPVTRLLKRGKTRAVDGAARGL